MSESDPVVEVYASKFCPYCHWARRLLDRKGVAYKLYDVDGNAALRQEMNKRSRRSSVPQIFLDDMHIGGFDELSSLDRTGKLDELLHKNVSADCIK